MDAWFVRLGVCAPWPGFVRLVGGLCAWAGVCAPAPLGLGAQPRFAGALWRASFLETAENSNLDFKKKVAPLCDEMRIFFGNRFPCRPQTTERIKTHSFLMIRSACQKNMRRSAAKRNKKTKSSFGRRRPPRQWEQNIKKPMVFQYFS